MTMSRVLRVASVFCVVLSLAGPGRGGEPAEARKVIDRAVQAAGGAARLAVLEAATWEGEGKLYAGGVIRFQGKWAMQGQDRGRVVSAIDTGGRKTTVVVVVNGDKGWLKVDETVTELDRETFAEHKRHCYAQELALLLPFARKDRGLKLAAAGETKAMGRPAVGVRVTRDGHPEVRLFFDRESGLPVRCEWAAGPGGKEVHELHLSDYQEVGGLKRPMKVVGKMNGKVVMEYAVRDYRVVAKLDEGLFTKP
jgi:hypothetical protein